MRSNNEQPAGRPYMVVDCNHMPLARAVLESPPDAETWQIRVLDDGVDAVLRHETIEVIGMISGSASLMCRIISHRGDRLVLERVRALSGELREHLRIPLHFESFIYPLTGSWTGRLPVTGQDLSCGGVAFFCDAALDNREQFEIVLPVTTQPLLLKAEILKIRPASGRVPLYAAKFVDLETAEEQMVQEAVFSIQLQHRKDRRSTNAPYR